MHPRTEGAQELQALADRNGAMAPSSAGPNYIIRECAKCGVLGCNLMEGEEKK